MAYNRFKVMGLVNAFVKLGCAEAEIYHKVITDKEFARVDGAEKEHIRKEVEILIAKHANYEEVQRIMNCKVVMLQDLKNKIISYDPITNYQREHSYDALVKIIHGEILNSKLILAYSEYNPRKIEKIYKDDKGATIFNRYQPPSWLRDHFFNGTPIEPKPMPEIYIKFFTHLMGGDEASYNYLINWIAYSIRERNLTMLGAVGEQGVGKGTLASIIAALHGVKEKNATASASGSKLGKQFNAILDAKTFVEFSEIQLKSTEQQDNYKNLINSELEIEKKGVDGAMAINYCNFLITSNSMQKIQIAAGDRRLSLLNLTKTKMTQNLKALGFTEINECRRQLHDVQENINNLAAYLWHYKVDTKLLSEPFKSKSLEALQKSNLYDWEKEFISSIAKQFAGKALKLTEVVQLLSVQVNSSLKLKERNFRALEQKLKPLLKDKDLFTMSRVYQDDGSRPLIVQIAPVKNQPDESFLDNFEEINEHLET